MTESTTQHVGYLLAGKAICKACAARVVWKPLEEHRTRLYAVNLYPYQQHCFLCSAHFFKGADTVQMDLFD